MSFDDIPEDIEPSYECECGGNIKTNPETGVWECDTCDWNEDKDVVPNVELTGASEPASEDQSRRFERPG